MVLTKPVSWKLRTEAEEKDLCGDARSWWEKRAFTCARVSDGVRGVEAVIGMLQVVVVVVLYGCVWLWQMHRALDVVLGPSAALKQPRACLLALRLAGSNQVSFFSQTPTHPDKLSPAANLDAGCLTALLCFSLL